MVITFNMFGAPTTLSSPLRDLELPGFSMFAEVVCHLSFLKLNFIWPPELLDPMASPALTFPRTKYTLTLWHRRFGHVGMDTTWETLTKDYMVGIQYAGPFTQENCVACIIGKSPQHSYSHNGH
jgi:hypothetical protein